MVDLSDFKRALGSFPSGVVVATTVDPAGRPWGFTASSFASVSLEPPLILVCPARTAECYAAFKAASVFSVNVLRSDDEAVARRFATRGASKFEGNDFFAGEHGLPLLRGAIAALVCRKFSQQDCGDHCVIVGEVESVRLASSGNSLVYYRQKFWQFEPLLVGELKPDC